MNINIKDISKLLNVDEVSDVRLISKDDLVDEVKSEKMSITPWFKLIVNNKIDEIYQTAKNLEKISKDVKNELKIVRYI